MLLPSLPPPGPPARVILQSARSTCLSAKQLGGAATAEVFDAEAEGRQWVVEGW